MSAPSVIHLVESALYASDLERAEAFYKNVLNLPLIAKEIPRHLFFQAGDSVLLIFNPEETLHSIKLPPHGATGPGHVALGIAKTELDTWLARLNEHGIPVEKRVHWPGGGDSLYVRDPAGNAVELITKGCWGLPGGW